ncbi:hypothetical protein M8J77_002628 [Diaphorina citri]|nr:hypothetical protein M8J77_002628 [Diaphorina citri]
MQPADAAVSRRMNISWYAVKWRRHALTQISLRQMRGQSTSQTSGEERFDEKEEDTESKVSLRWSHLDFGVFFCMAARHGRWGSMNGKDLKLWRCGCGKE